MTEASRRLVGIRVHRTAPVFYAVYEVTYPDGTVAVQVGKSVRADVDERGFVRDPAMQALFLAALPIIKHLEERCAEADGFQL